MRKLVHIVVFGLIVLGLAFPASTSAQTGSRFFPETGHTVSGRLLEFWQNNGGLPVFGYPLTEQFSENGLQVQYFERQRLELHPELTRPYDVLLGRLGAQLWGPAYAPPASGPASGCIWFPETQQNVCNQETGNGFASYWQLNGLEFDGRPAGKIYQESLALFGYPITGLVEFPGPNGMPVQAQWFERARFEWHPGNPNPYKVLLGRLGADLAPTTPPPATVDRAKIFLIAVGDNGVSGKPIGCGDSVLGVDVTIPPTPAPLQGALNYLLSLNDPNYGESGFSNTLAPSDLRVDSATIVNGLATVNMSGTLVINGVCDAPRVQAQLEETVRQFSSVSSVSILLNGRPLAESLSER